MLRRIALETFRRTEIFISKAKLTSLIGLYLAELPPDDVRQGIDGEVVLRAMEAQHGLIIERAHDIHSFSHLTIHEYFTAKKVVESTKTDEIVALMRQHANDDQWREVILMVASLLDDGRFLIDAFTKILSDLSNDYPRITTFVRAAISSHKEATTKARRYGSPNQRADVLSNGDAVVIANCCITVAGNMRVLGLEERYLELPRLIAAALQADPDLVSRHYLADSKSLTASKSFFRLAALITECMNLTTLPERATYLHTLFDPIRPRPL